MKRQPSHLRAFREATGLTQDDVHERTGISQSSLSKYERGRMPSSQNAAKLATLYNRTIEEILHGPQSATSPVMDGTENESSNRRSVSGGVDELSDQARFLAGLATGIPGLSAEDAGTHLVRIGQSFIHLGERLIASDAESIIGGRTRTGTDVRAPHPPTPRKRRAGR